MQKTRKEAIDEFLGFMGEGGDPAARTIAEALLPRVIEGIWLKHPWRDYQSPSPLELTLVANQRSYPMPDFYGRPGKGRVRNLTTGAVLDPLDQQQADEIYPARGTTLEAAGRPRHYLQGGIVGVQRQPAVTGEALEIVSDAAADAADMRVSIVGADANGTMRRRSLTLNGTTAVAAGTWAWVDEFGKGLRAGVAPATVGTSSVGTITLRKVSDGTVLQELYPEESAREHRVVTFLPKPSQADVVSFPVMRRPPRLIYDADAIPGDWWNATLEEMTIQWRVNRGELAVDSEVPRPHLLDLIAADNVNGPAPVRRPFGV